VGIPRETAVEIPGAIALHAVVHGCTLTGHPAWGVVFCGPFAEEKKCAHRVLVEAARGFCSADIACLRFDYRGTGDSPGEFAEATPEQWVEDILAATAYLRSAHGVTTVGLLGLRLGGALALRAAATGEGVDFLVLWEPVIDGKQYLAQNLRRSLIKAMLTDEAQFDAGQVRASQGEEYFDFDGYRVSREMRRQIEEISLLDEGQAFTGPSLVVNVGPREQPSDPLVRLAEQLGGQAIAVRQEPFWNRIGLVEPGPVVQVTEIWLAEQQASWLPDHRR
jgi:uncharacterized protein